VQIWIVFLLVSFVFGARAAGSGRRERPVLILLGCLVVAALFTFERFG
jgi:hypothetical protein